MRSFHVFYSAVSDFYMINICETISQSIEAESYGIPKCTRKYARHIAKNFPRVTFQYNGKTVDTKLGKNLLH